MKANSKSKNNTLIIVLSSLLFGLSSCFDSKYDFNNISDEIELTPEVSIPLAYGFLTIDDILSEADSGEFVKKDNDSLLYIYYFTNLYSYKASEVIDIPDQNFLQFFIDSDVAFASFLPVPVGDTVFKTKYKNGEFIFSNGEKIDSVNLSSVQMVLNVSSGFHHTGNLTIYSDNILVKGKPFRKVIKISDPSGNFTYSLDSMVTNVKLILDNSNPDTTFLPLKFDLALINSGAIVLPGEKCNITMSFRQNEFSSMFGYLGEYDILVTNGQIDLSLFNESVQGGSLRFADPRIALTVNNSYGIPVQIDLSGTNVSSILSGTNVPIIFNPGVNPFTIDAPAIDSIGKYSYSEVPINKDNSNILDAMEISPNHLNYTTSAKTNAMGPTGPYNFVTDSSSMDLGLQLVLPLWVKAEGYSLEDTVDFDFEDQFGSNVDYIEYFRLSMHASNGIPIEVKLQAYFTDASYNVIDSLFRDNDVFLDPAPVGPDEKVSAPIEMTNSVEYTKSDLEKLKQSKFLRVKASINTPKTGTGYFKYYSYYGIDFKLSVKTNLRINSNDL
jgi:hypothetical protein